VHLHALPVDYVMVIDNKYSSTVLNFSKYVATVFWYNVIISKEVNNELKFA
jgi:hypothetical protein